MNAPKYTTNTNLVAEIDGVQHLGVITGGYTYENEWWYHLSDGNNVMYAKESAVKFYFNGESWVNTDQNAQVSTIYSNPS